MLRPALAIAKEKLLEAGYLNAPAGVILFSRHEDGHRYGLVEKEYEDSRGRVYPFPSFPTGTTDVTVVGTDGQEIMRCSLNKPRKQMRFLNESTLIPAKQYKRELARLEELADVNNRQVFDQEFVALLVRHFGEEAVRVEHWRVTAQRETAEEAQIPPEVLGENGQPGTARWVTQVELNLHRNKTLELGEPPSHDRLIIACAEGEDVRRIVASSSNPNPDEEDNELPVAYTLEEMQARLLELIDIAGRSHAMLGAINRYNALVQIAAMEGVEDPAAQRVGPFGSADVSNDNAELKTALKLAEDDKHLQLQVPMTVIG